MIKGFKKEEHNFLSNFHPCELVVEGIEYSTVENAFQAFKTLNKADRKYISTLTPGKAKRYGRRIDLRPDWEDIKVPLMRLLLEEKFSTNPELKQALLNTGDEHIEETNTWGDTFWGVCNGVGENYLGELLMEIRGELK